jgi:hypothetical protein
MTAPLNPAPTMQYLMPPISDCFEENYAILAGCRWRVPSPLLARRLRALRTSGEPLKNLMPSSNPRALHDQVSTRFPKWL